MKVIRFGHGAEKIAIVGSLHGNELIGKNVILRLSKDKKIAANVTAIIANEPAIKAGKRFVDVDGNRCFPGKKNGNNEERIAFSILRELKGCKYVIDLHSTFADMDDTIILTKKSAMRLADMVPISKVAVMGHAIAKGRAINDYPRLCVSLEFSRKRSASHAIHIVRTTIDNIVNKKKAGIEKDTYFVKEILKGDARNFRMKNYVKVRKGDVMDRVAGTVSDEMFFPIFFSEKAYEGTVCLKAYKD